MGAPVEADDVQDAIEEAIRIITAAGKPAGILTLSAELNKKYIALGAKYVAVGIDITALSAALDDLAAEYGLIEPASRAGPVY